MLLFVYDVGLRDGIIHISNHNDFTYVNNKKKNGSSDFQIIQKSCQEFQCLLETKHTISENCNLLEMSCLLVSSDADR